MKRDSVVANFMAALKRDKLLRSCRKQIITEILETAQLANGLFAEEALHEINNVCSLFFNSSVGFTDQAKELNLSKKEVWKKYKAYEEFLGSIIVSVLSDYIVPIFSDDEVYVYDVVYKYLDRYRKKYTFKRGKKKMMPLEGVMTNDNNT